MLLGDALELRHGPVREAVQAAEPVFARLAEALGPDGELLLVSGNHDHALVAPWLESRAAYQLPPPLKLEERPGPRASGPVARLAKAVTGQGARFELAYPGVWLRPDVYAMHGHFLDRLITVPTFERLAAGAMGRVAGSLPLSGATPEDFESALTPLYAWMHAVAQSQRPGFAAEGQGASASSWQTLTASGRMPLKARALQAAFPVAVGLANRLGFGPVRAELSGQELRTSGLLALGRVVALLGIEAEHVVFGHTHRAGPLPGDSLGEWTAPTGARLHNAGCWIDEPVFATGGPRSPYWGGRAIRVDADGPPRLERIVEDLSGSRG